MTDTKAFTEHWTRVADQWIGWAGKPGHDAFWRPTRRRCRSTRPAQARYEREQAPSRGRACRCSRGSRRGRCG